MFQIGSPLNMLPAVFGGTVVEFICIGLFIFLKYRCNYVLQQYFINQAQLSLVERLNLDQNLKLSRTLLHSAIFYCLCHSTLVVTLFIFIIFKNAPIIQEFHLEMSSFLGVTIPLLIGVMHPLIFFKEIPVLRKQFFIKFSKNLVKPIDLPRNDEGDLRLKHLSEMWNSAYVRT